MSENIDKEVRFDLYCKKCKFFENEEYEDPCDECLNYPSNTYSHKPLYFEESEKNHEFELQSCL